jgi:hypothetical protein
MKQCCSFESAAAGYFELHSKRMGGYSLVKCNFSISLVNFHRHCGKSKANALLNIEKLNSLNGRQTNYLFAEFF